MSQKHLFELTEDDSGSTTVERDPVIEVWASGHSD